MRDDLEPVNNHEKTKKIVGFIPRNEATAETYRKLGFRCGLEIHQQLKTAKKLFCRCPAGIYQAEDDYDAEIVRHMRPTLSELGEYDGTALMEFKTRKEIIYRIKNETACTYEIDDTPPFPMDREALEIALEVALLLKTSIVGEIHITRKQYLDGSIPTGFQRTAILGIDGEIPLRHKRVRIRQLSIEEDACREVSDIGHLRIYMTDRLGMPLIETVTYPDLETPEEAAEAGQYLRFLSRSTNRVRTGMGAAREDVNVSISGGTRVEIKGVAHIDWIPRLTHTEAFRQKSLLAIQAELDRRGIRSKAWRATHVDVTESAAALVPELPPGFRDRGDRMVAVNLPGFAGLLSHFTQPGRGFADEIADRLKVIACLEKPNMTCSEDIHSPWDSRQIEGVRGCLKCGPRDAQILFWGPQADVRTAVDTVEERCRLAMEGVPNETRKALEDGNTLFERVLPGPDRMYPDTDSAPIPIAERQIEKTRNTLPGDVVERLTRMREWGIPADTFTYILKRNLYPLLEKIVEDFKADPVFTATLLGHRLKHLEGCAPEADGFPVDRIYRLFAFVQERSLERSILPEMLNVIHRNPGMDLDAVLAALEYRKKSLSGILDSLPGLRRKFSRIRTSRDGREAEIRWIMGRMRPLALGNVDLGDLREKVASAGGSRGTHE